MSVIEKLNFLAGNDHLIKEFLDFLFEINKEACCTDGETMVSSIVVENMSPNKIFNSNNERKKKKFKGRKKMFLHCTLFKIFCNSWIFV